jgi:hypothetical protein
LCVVMFDYNGKKQSYDAGSPSSSYLVT